MSNDAKEFVSTRKRRQFIAKAKELYEKEGEIEIDDNAEISTSDADAGAYVQAWVWVEGNT